MHKLQKFATSRLVYLIEFITTTDIIFMQILSWPHL